MVASILPFALADSRFPVIFMPRLFRRFVVCSKTALFSVRQFQHDRMGLNSGRSTSFHALHKCEL